VSVLLVCLIAAVLAYVGSIPVIGPISVMAITRGIDGRFDEARKLGMGSAVAEGTYAAIAFGFTTFFTRYPIALPISRVLTCIVLSIVGISCLRYTPKPVDATAAVPERKSRSAFALGFVTSAFNPSIIGSWAAVAAAIHSRQFVEMKTWMAVPFGLSATLGITGWFFTLAALMTKYHSRLPARGMRITVRVLGAVLLAVSLWTLYGVLSQWL
jgi:threonine/homoserine/homoserine lactone efflux protein